MSKNKARDERARKNRPKDGVCLHCHSSFNIPPTGRIPKYCDVVCKGKYHANSAKRVDWENNNIDRRMFYRCRNRAKTLGLPFDLTLEDCTVPTICPVLGIELGYRKGQGYHPATPSMDRIIPSKGYVKGNVRVISWKANMIKTTQLLKN